MPNLYYKDSRKKALENPRECIKCTKRKPLEDFNTAKNCLFGKSYECKDCCNKRQREWRKERIKDPEFASRRYFSQQKHLAKRSGLSTEEYIKLSREVKNCQICGSLPSMSGRPHNRLHADHDHVTGKFRGMLCGNCNVVLGLVKDKPQTLISLAEYLKCHMC